MFGYSEEQISHFGMTFCLGAFMLFIICHLAWQSKAGKFGTFVIMSGLGLGMAGFNIKLMLEWYLS